MLGYAAKRLGSFPFPQGGTGLSWAFNTLKLKPKLQREKPAKENDWQGTVWDSEAAWNSFAGRSNEIIYTLTKWCRYVKVPEKIREGYVTFNHISDFMKSFFFFFFFLNMNLFGILKVCFPFEAHIKHRGANCNQLYWLAVTPNRRRRTDAHFLGIFSRGAFAKALIHKNWPHLPIWECTSCNGNHIGLPQPSPHPHQVIHHG